MKRDRRVMSLDDGRVYDSVADAAFAAGVSVRVMRDHLAGFTLALGSQCYAWVRDVREIDES